MIFRQVQQQAGWSFPRVLAGKKRGSLVPGWNPVVTWERSKEEFRTAECSAFFLGVSLFTGHALCDIDRGVCGLFQFLLEKEGVRSYVLSEVLKRPAEKRAPV